MKFFTDRDLGNIFPKALKKAGLDVEKLEDHFEPNTHDDIWLPEVGRRGWIAVSANYKIYYSPNERDAMFRAGTRLFIVIGKAPFPELADNFVACIHKIEKFVKANPPPFIARIYRPPAEEIRRGSRKSGKIELWLSYDGWIKKVSSR